MEYKIIICDDSAEDAAFLTELTSFWGKQNGHTLHIETYPSAEAFLFRYEEDKTCDILLLDVEMPGKSGVELAKELTQRSAMKYDRDGDQHYDLLSAFQKSIRGSDENAALHYMARLLVAGDLPSVCRRLLVTAAEDIGLAYPNGIVIAKACVESALQLGLPEARIPLAEAVIALCTAPKSNSAEAAVDAAIADVEAGNTGDFPRHLQNKHYDGEGAKEKGQNYLYPHDYPNHYVKQQYLPDPIKDRVYYHFGDNKLENAAREYREKIKKQS